MRAERLVTHPLFVFAAVWSVIAASASLRVSASFQRDLSPLYHLLTVSLVCFGAGYVAVAMLGASREARWITEFHSAPVVARQTRRVMFASTLAIIAIMALNVRLDGLPPFFAFLGADTLGYLEYGRLKGALFALAPFTFLLSAYAGRRLGLLMKAISLGVLVLYVSRGYVIFSLLAYFFLILQLRNVRFWRLVLYLCLLLATVLALMEIVGHYRTGTASFFQALDIRAQYRDLNAGLVWLLAYVSMPAINIIELTQHEVFFHGKALYSASMPAFLAIDEAARSHFVAVIPNRYNTASGYLTNAYLDFGWYGVALYNLLLGMVASAVHRFSPNLLIKSILLACLALMFFNDYFLYFTTLFMIALSVPAYRHLHRPACLKRIIAGSPQRSETP